MSSDNQYSNIYLSNTVELAEWLESHPDAECVSIKAPWSFWSERRTEGMFYPYDSVEDKYSLPVAIRNHKNLKILVFNGFGMCNLTDVNILTRAIKDNNVIKALCVTIKPLDLIKDDKIRRTCIQELMYNMYHSQESFEKLTLRTYMEDETISLINRECDNILKKSKRCIRNRHVSNYRSHL